MLYSKSDCANLRYNSLGDLNWRLEFKNAGVQNFETTKEERHKIQGKHIGCRLVCIIY